MRTTLTDTEQKIIEMLQAMDILTDQMNDMAPVVVESMELDRWKELYNYREELFEDLYKTVEGYIKENGQQEDAEECWKDVYATQENCSKALDLVIKLENEERISMDEYRTISKPLNRELQNVQRFAVAKVIEKKKELASGEGENSNPLNFII